jgi:hypothetical protein
MAAVQYESKENAGSKFWTGRYGRLGQGTHLLAHGWLASG